MQNKSLFKNSKMGYNKLRIKNQTNQINKQPRERGQQK